MASRQHYAAMIHFGDWKPRRVGMRQRRALNQSTAACRTPIRYRFFRKQGVTLAANPFHGY
jgi:hypothetical protein